jgi:hypothetical protein
MKLRNKHYNIIYFATITLLLLVLYQRNVVNPVGVFLLFVVHCIVCIANGIYFYLISFSNAHCNKRDFYSSVKMKDIIANISEYFDDLVMAKRYILFVRMIPCFLIVACLVMIIFMFYI